MLYSVRGWLWEMVSHLVLARALGEFHLLNIVSDDRCMGLAASFGFAAKADCFSKLSFFKGREDSHSI